MAYLMLKSSNFRLRYILDVIIYGNRSYSGRRTRKDEIAYFQCKKLADIRNDFVY